MNALPLAALVFLAACSPALLNEDESQGNRAAVVGEWDLVSTTSNGRGGPPTTTTSPPGQLAFRFAPDGTVGMYYDGTLTLTSTYAVELQSEGLPCVRIGENRRCLTVRDDTFVADARPSDGPLRVYRRR